MRVWTRGWRWLLVGVMLTWGCARAETAPSVDEGGAAAAPAPAEAHWYGVYLSGRKVGHAQMKSELTPNGRVLQDVIEMRLAGEGAGISGHRATVTIQELRRYDPDPPHRLAETTTEQRSRLMTDRRTAVRRGGVMVVTRVIDGATQAPREIPASAETYADHLRLSPRDLGSIPAEGVVKAVVFDWQHEGDDEVEVRLRRRSQVPHAGVETDVAEFELRYTRSGVVAQSYVAAGGLTLRMTMGMGLELRLEEQAVAVSSVVGLDVLAAGVAVARPLGAPGAVERLVLTLTAGADVTVPASDRQRVTALGEGRVRVDIDRRRQATVTAEARDKFLGADATMDSDHPEVAARARELTAGIAGEDEKVGRLLAFVGDHVEDALATHVPTASQVLARRIGDCTEHAWLFVGLARAAGLPARPVYGLAYVGDSAQKFGYHAWAEVAVDGRWQAVDPMWAQRRADATHLVLAYDPLAIAQVMGGLSITVDEIHGGPENPGAGEGAQKERP